MVIEAFGLTDAKLQARFPPVWQWLFERVKPERDANVRATYRENWWVFGEPRTDLPAAPAWPRTDAIGQITMISRALRSRPAAAADLRKQFRNPPQTATVQHILASLAQAGQARALPDGRYVM